MRQPSHAMSSSIPVTRKPRRTGVGRAVRGGRIAGQILFETLLLAVGVGAIGAGALLLR